MDLILYVQQRVPFVLLMRSGRRLWIYRISSIVVSSLQVRPVLPHRYDNDDAHTSEKAGAAGHETETNEWTLASIYGVISCICSNVLPFSS